MSKQLLSHIRKAHKGDRKAQEVLYRQYRSMWYMISMRYGKNKMQAEDILQEGLIRIFNDLGKFDPSKGKFSSWSSRIIVNAALRYLQKTSWNNTFTDLDQAEEVSDDFESIIDQISSKELTEMIQKLPLGYRIVFNMNVIEGYTHKEIGKELGISEGTSKSQLAKARKLLRKVLESQLKISRL